MRMPKIEIVTDDECIKVLKSGCIGMLTMYHWRLKGRNGEIVCHSENYTPKSDARRAARKAVELMAKAEIAS